MHLVTEQRVRKFLFGKGIQVEEAKYEIIFKTFFFSFV